jgi:CheY-like chemotaxis protein
VLSLSKIERGQVKFNFKRENLDSFFEELRTIVLPTAEAKGVTLQMVRHGISAKYLIGDRLHVEQLLMNVLNNAIKFTPSGGTVQLDVEVDHMEGDTVYARYTIADNGIGISEEFLPHLFEPFTREGASDQPGTGLGLCIVKRLVDGLGGTIRVESQKNVGTTFRIVLPFTMCPQDGTSQISVPPVRKTGSLAGRRILLCEDQPMNVQITVKLLEKKQMAVDVAINGRQGMEKFSAAAPGYYAAILMDVRMPVMDGLAATRAIRALGRSDAGSIPIIAMSANAFDEDIERSLEAGMTAYLAKPVEPEKLYRTLSEFIDPAGQSD